MKSLVHTEELCSRSVPLEHAPGAKSLVCIGLKAMVLIYWARKLVTLTCDCCIMHLIYRSKFCITIVSIFSWVLQSSQEKSKSMVVQNLAG